MKYIFCFIALNSILSKNVTTIQIGDITLDSGIDVAPGKNIAPGTFGKYIELSP